MIYLWYSGATDVTGRALATALEIEGTREQPRLRAGDILIGWGTKISRDINIPNDVIVYNHPNAIRINRNKLKALDIMSQNQELENNIAKYVKAGDVMDELRRVNIRLPLIGRTSYHQGGKGLWICLTKSHVQSALDDGADYFQEYIDVKNEYRLHVVFDKIIYAVKKVENNNIDHWIAQRKEKILDYAAKNEWNLDNDTLDKALKVLAKEVIIPDRIVRSNKRGWTFSRVNISNLSRNLKNVAIKAVEAIGLDFGAVDCAIDVNNNPYIIEVNSGPGLQGTSFDKYVAAFREKLNERPMRRVRRAVGAEAVEPERDEPINENQIDDDGLVRVIRNVRNDAEARAVIDLIMRRQNG